MTPILLPPPGIPENEWEDLQGISAIKTLKINEHFISEGQVPQKFAIVLKGLFRYYYINDKGDEFTKGFILPGNIMSAYSAMAQQTPALFFVQALTDTEFIAINYRKWLTLQEKNPFWDKFLIKALEKGYYTKEKRERELLLLDAEARYRIFLAEFPDLDKVVKLHMIASYLGIQPESLSRIRKRINA